MNRPTPFSLVVQCLAWSALALAYHAALQAWMAATGSRLGWIDAHLAAPLHAHWAVGFPGAWAAPALVVLAGTFAVRRRLFRNDRLAGGSFVLLASALFVAVGVSLAYMDGFSEREGRPMPSFMVQHSKPWLESQGDVTYLERVGLRRFSSAYAAPRRLARLANHSRSHPPGPVLFQWAIARIFGTGLGVAPFAELGFGALFVALTYLLGAELHGDAAARLGVALALLAPNVVMFATSMDLPFTVFLLLPAWLFVRAARRGESWTAALSGVAMAVAGFMTFSTLLLVVILTLWFALEWRREPLRRAQLLRAAALGSVTCWTAFAALLWVSGYEPLRALPVQHAWDVKQMDKQPGNPTRLLNLGVANLMAFLIGLGAPLVCLTARGLWRRAGSRDALLVAVAGTLLLFSFSSLFTLEVERIWLFMTPLLAVAAGASFARDDRAGFETALGLSCVLLWLTEAALVTAW